MKHVALELVAIVCGDAGCIPFSNQFFYKSFSSQLFNFFFFNPTFLQTGTNVQIDVCAKGEKLERSALLDSGNVKVHFTPRHQSRRWMNEY